jgi:hypothetical protein
VWKARASWAVATAVSFVSLFISVSLFVRVLQEGTISYAIGAWEAVGNRIQD